MNDKTLEGLEKALQYGGGEHNVGDVIAKILANEAQLWQAEGALIVTEIHLTPRKKVCHFWLATGDMAAVIGLSYDVLDWAKGEGCDKATLAGRMGWKKVLATEGWSPELLIMGQEL